MKDQYHRMIIVLWFEAAWPQCEISQQKPKRAKVFRCGKFVLGARGLLLAVVLQNSPCVLLVAATNL
jgi:hypothetical protein